LRVLTGSGAALRRLVPSEIAKTGATDVTRQEGGEWGSLLSENRGKGLFDDKSVIVVEDAEQLGPLPKRLAPLLEGEDAAVHIILVCKGEASSVVPKEFMDRCAAAKASEPSPWSRERDEIIVAAAKKSGVRISNDAVSLLKDLFEDTGELAAEAEKAAAMCLAGGENNVTAERVSSFCMSDGSRSMLKLLDGICAGDAAESLSRLADLSRHSELTPLLSAMHNRFRLAMYFSRGKNGRAVFARSLEAKDYASKQADMAVKKYGAEKVRDFVAGLIRIAASERVGGGASWKDLNLLIVNLMSGVTAK
jgi:DNA polymerase-3 subunit delta